MANFTTLIYLTILHRFHFIPPDPITASIPCSRHVIVIGIISDVPSSSCSLFASGTETCWQVKDEEGMEGVLTPHGSTDATPRRCLWLSFAAHSLLWPFRCCPPLGFLTLSSFHSAHPASHIFAFVSLPGAQGTVIWPIQSKRGCKTPLENGVQERGQWSQAMRTPDTMFW